MCLVETQDVLPFLRVSISPSQLTISRSQATVWQRCNVTLSRGLNSCSISSRVSGITDAVGYCTVSSAHTAFRNYWAGLASLTYYLIWNDAKKITRWTFNNILWCHRALRARYCAREPHLVSLSDYPHHMPSSTIRVHLIYLNQIPLQWDKFVWSRKMTSEERWKQWR